MFGATVSAGLVSGLADFAAAQGTDKALLLETAGITSYHLSNPDNRVPFAHYIKLMRLAHTATANPALALHYGEQVGMSEVSVLGLIMEASATMGEAFLQLQRYGRLATEFIDTEDTPRTELIFRDGRMFMVFHWHDPNAFPEMTEESFARLVCGPRRFLDQPHVLSVHVTHPAPSYSKEYERVFQCPVHFSAGWNAMELHPEITTRKVARNPRYVFSILTRHADALLVDLDAAKTVRGKLEALLLPIIHLGNLKADTLAAQMGFSRQTLFRKLKDEDTSFNNVIDTLRQRLAEEYLRGQKASINEAAYLCGFSEPASFTRAFKRWTGKTPGQYCRKNASS